jgi:3-hydroxyacyl-CoA dehydrogenase
MTKVAIVGAGLIGRGWALSFARAGHDVALHDAVPGAVDGALTFIDGALADLAKYDLLSGRARRTCRRTRPKRST